MEASFSISSGCKTRSAGLKLDWIRTEVFFTYWLIL